MMGYYLGFVSSNYRSSLFQDKAVYKPPTAVSSSIWRDCWIIRAAGADGCSGRYVVAASAGNSLDSGFCSWDFYTKDVRAFHIEGEGKTTSRTVLGPLPNNNIYRRNAFSSVLVPETNQWWYKPCGPLIASAASSQRVVTVYDIRDGEQIMQWEVQKPVLTMDYSSPLQWRNRGKLVVAEAETISLWDVNSLNPQTLLSVSSCGRKISALHVNNTDAELGGGVRQRFNFHTLVSVYLIFLYTCSGSSGLLISILSLSFYTIFCIIDICVCMPLVHCLQPLNFYSVFLYIMLLM